MKERSPYTRSDILIVVIAALAGAIVSALFMTWYLNRDNRWQAIVVPTNEKAVKIIAADRLLRPYVQTDAGNLYLCGGGTWRDACQQVSPALLPADRVPMRWTTCNSPLPETPPLLGTVVDAVEGGRCSEAQTYAKVVLLEDGTLWQWQRTYTWWNQFAAGTCIIMGIGLGALAGVLVVRTRRYLRSAPATHSVPGPDHGSPAAMRSGTTCSIVASAAVLYSWHRAD